MNCYNDWAEEFMDRAIDSVSGQINMSQNNDRRKMRGEKSL